MSFGGYLPGLAFKPDTDDLRESPVSMVASSLTVFDLRVICIKPNIEAHPNFLTTSLDYVLKNADAIVILVGYKEFRSEENKEHFINAKAMDI